MRPALSCLCLPALTLLLACGGSDDPLAQKCEAACGNVSAPSPCANETSKAKCLNDCRALATQATSAHSKSCGECIADSFKYSAKPGCDNDPTCCWGTAHANPSDDACKTKCFEPDGGVAF